MGNLICLVSSPTSYNPPPYTLTRDLTQCFVTRAITLAYNNVCSGNIVCLSVCLLVWMIYLFLLESQ